jgi:hypothetical protein
MNLLPPFTVDGLLPPGEYELTIEQLLSSMLVAGPAGFQDWNAVWRTQLVKNLDVLAGHLRRVGIVDIFVDGSFVEEKAEPGDIDGYFVCDRYAYMDGMIETALQAIDSVWTWDPERRYAPDRSRKLQLPMWHKYRVELYPHIGQLSGIRDVYGNELEFPSAFRQSRTFQPKGIIKLSRGVS